MQTERYNNVYANLFVSSIMGSLPTTPSSHSALSKATMKPNEQLKYLLLTTIAAVLLVGCSDPEAEANKLYTQAAQLVKQADDSKRDNSFSAYNKRKMAIALLDKIQVQYPQSSLSVKISEGDFKIQSQSLDEIRKKMNLSELIGLASSTGDIKAVKQHLAAGTDVNAKNDDGWAPLHLAAHEGHKEIVELLIAKGANVNAKVKYGRTPLFYAAHEGHKEIAELLIASGADVNATDDGGKTPLDWAISNDHTETAALLRKHGGKTGEELKAEAK
jgi:ankyrin repeat protein